MILDRKLTERLLQVMDRKNHWAYPALTLPGLSKGQLFCHFRHEFEVYVRDFPVLVARALGQVPPLSDVRTALAENVYEEQTGGLSKTGPHPELFVRMMEGLGFARADFESPFALGPRATKYRDFLLETSASPPWQIAVAVLTIFVEGSVNERAELEGRFVRPPPEEAVKNHPLVKHYGLPREAMVLTRAHAIIEREHRQDAWKSVLAHVRDGSELASDTVGAMERSLSLWLDYRDEVAENMHLRRDS